MLLDIFLILMLLFAFLSVQARLMRTAVIHLGVFSLVSAMVYFLYKAPDVGLAEVIIGSTLTTILYLVAMQKYETITVYFRDERKQTSKRRLAMEKQQGQRSRLKSTPLLRQIEAYCQEQEYEMNLVWTTEPIEVLQENLGHDLIVVCQDDAEHLYAKGQNYVGEEVLDLLGDEEGIKPHLNLS